MKKPISGWTILATLAAVAFLGKWQGAQKQVRITAQQASRAESGKAKAEAHNAKLAQSNAALMQEKTALTGKLRALEAKPKDKKPSAVRKTDLPKSK